MANGGGQLHQYGLGFGIFLEVTKRNSPRQVRPRGVRSAWVFAGEDSTTNHDFWTTVVDNNFAIREPNVIIKADLPPVASGD